MRVPPNRTILAFAGLVFTIASARLVYADTYTTYALANSAGSVANIGLTDQGAVTLFSAVSDMYTTFTPPSTSTSSSTAPQLTYNNGAACTPSVAGFSGVTQATCNGGYIAFEDSTLRAFFVVDPGQSAQLLYAGGVTNVLLNAYGDVAFTGVGISTDTNYLAYDISSHVTPEPASWLLLTSAGGVLAFCRRRLGLV